MLETLKKEYVNQFQAKRFLTLRALLFYYRSVNCRVVVLIYTALKTSNQWIKAKLLRKLLIKYGVTVGAHSRVGKNLKIEHHQGIVIGRNAVLGDNCTIYQQVTLGQKEEKFPTVGNNVVIYPGARIIGDITIGNNVVIGTNAVVLKSVPDNCIVAGVPAKIIGKVQE